MEPLYVAILLYFLALCLAFFDLFIPSGGALIYVSGLTALASVLFGFQAGQNVGTAMLAVVFLSVPAFAFLAVRIWPLTPIGRRVILPAKKREDAKQEADSDEQLIGQIVETDSPLLPAGQIRILGKSRNAVARSGVIEAGQNVEIVGVKDFNLVVVVTTLPVTLSSRSPIVTPAGDASSAERGKEAEAKSSEAETIPEAGNLLDLPAEELGLDDLD